MIKKLADRLLKWFCHPAYYDEIHGDMEELYQRNMTNNIRFSQWKYLFQIISLFRPSLLRPLFTNLPFKHMMLLNYFKISSRILIRQKLYSSINILGLAVGMGVSLLIYQYIHFELSYDKFHADAQHIYRLTQTVVENGEITAKGVDVTYGLGASIQEEIPEVKQMVRINPQDVGLILINEENDVRHQENNIWYVDDNFLQLFNFPLKYGDKASVLSDMHNIVLTDELAYKYFGDENPIGKEMRVSGGTLTGNFVVTGVLKKLPENTHLQFDILMPIQFVLTHWRMYREDGDWDVEDFTTYVSLEASANLEKTASKVDHLTQKFIGDALKELNIEIRNGFQPISEVHLKSAGFIGETAKNNRDIKNIFYFGIIGVFILMIAWINFINLSTAKAVYRAKEVGVRKSVGAQKIQLIYQFLFESLFINVLAAILALNVAYFLLPTLNNIVGNEISFILLNEQSFWIIFIATILVGAVVSGVYPALVLSSFSPISVLKSVTFKKNKGLNLRKGLITFQFFISIILISGTYLVYKQITFMKSRDLGYEMEKILVVNGPRVVLEKNRVSLSKLQEQFRTECRRHHTIKNVAMSSNVPSKSYAWSGSMWKPGQLKKEREIGYGVFIDTNFFETYSFEFLAKEHIPINDKSNIEFVVLSEESVKIFNFESPQAALNGELIVGGGDTLEIVGVVKNIHWNSLKKSHIPIVYGLDPQYGAFYSIKLNLSDIQASISHIEKTFKKIYPEDPFEFYFLDENFNNQYKADLQFGNLFLSFTTLAIIIACLGLFAMVSYSTSLRIKEIGIRKVLGASIPNLMLLISKEYLSLLFIAILLAVPIVFIGGEKWLENYAFKISYDYDIILVPAAGMLLIAIVTVSSRIYQSAKANPIHALRKE